MTAADWIDDLERKARAATPGPWSADNYGSGQQVTGATGTIFADTFALPENAKFIAAVDPDTILRLIEDNRRLSSVIKGHEAIAAALIKQAQNYNAEADRHASRVVAMEAENEDLTAERDALAARLAAVEALADETERAGDPLLRLDRLRAALTEGDPK